MTKVLWNTRVEVEFMLSKREKSRSRASQKEDFFWFGFEERVSIYQFKKKRKKERSGKVFQGKSHTCAGTETKHQM